MCVHIGSGVYVCAHRVISFNVACVKKVPIQILKTYVANSLSPPLQVTVQHVAQFAMQ